MCFQYLYVFWQYLFKILCEKVLIYCSDGCIVLITEGHNKFERVEIMRKELNEKLNGIELYFDGKPSEEVRNVLKSNKFRYHSQKKCWYAKQSETTMTVVKDLEELMKSFKQTDYSNDYIKAFNKVFESTLDMKVSMNARYRKGLTDTNLQAALEAIGGYNEFDPSKVYLALQAVDCLMPHLDMLSNPNHGCNRYDIEVGRESSPVVYIKIWNKELKNFNLNEPRIKEIMKGALVDEFSIYKTSEEDYGNTIIRMWWDECQIDIGRIGR